MSDDQNERPREHDEPEDEVEAHHKGGTRVAANEEPAQEGDDEVEAHRHVRVAAPDADKLA
jgi:hypothetical protein